MDQPDKIIRLKDLPDYVGLRRTQIEHWIEKGLFPKPIKLGLRAKGWLASEIAAWQHGRIAARARCIPRSRLRGKIGTMLKRKRLFEPDGRTELIAAALNYAAKGWPIFPCKPEDKAPHTPHGFKDATTDPEQIREWWIAHPNAMIGFACGEPSGIWVLDIDYEPERGIDGAVALAPYGELPETVRAATPRGGRHFYFRWVEGIGCRRGNLPKGCDPKGEGGYVILPPSCRLGDYLMTGRLRLMWARSPMPRNGCSI